MEKIKKLVKKGIYIKPVCAVVLIVILSLLLTLFMLWLQPDGLGDVYKCMVESNFMSLLLNYLPVLFVMLLLYAASANMILSVSLSSFVFLVMGVVNRYKILLRNDPFLPWDISLGGELMGIIKSFGFPMIALAIVLVLVYIALSIIAGFVLRSEKIKPALRIGGALGCLIIMYVLNSTLYQNVTVNQNLYVIGNVYNQVNTFNSKGFLYSFIYVHNTNRIAKPDDYDPSGVLQRISEFEKNGDMEDLVTPHIIMVMSEAFSEMPLNPDFDFTGYTDPLENYKEIKEESIAGEIVVPNLGGGTADTEFDVLTGLSTRHLRGAPFAFRLIGNDFEALPWVLQDMGYRSLGLHPGYAWFYNRQNVFRYFGFEDTVFVDAFSEEQNKGMYINEVATMDMLVSQFENHLRDYPGTPLYDFCVTIQNHGPYKDKYGVDQNFNLNTDISLSSDDANAIANYFEGMIDADQQLRRLVEYFRDHEEPVVLVYFGDHLPAFNQNVYNTFYPDLYEEGGFESITNLYKTPFLIWQNESAKKSTNIAGNRDAATMPEDGIISSNYLGGYLLELLGYNGISPFFDTLNILRGQFPIINEYQSFNMNKQSSIALDAAEKEELILYRNWEYYKVFDENY